MDKIDLKISEYSTAFAHQSKI